MLGWNPAEYDGTITDIYLYPESDMTLVKVGTMELTSGPVGGDPETFKQGAGGDYDTEITASDAGCNHLVAGVDFTAFSCDEGEYAAIFWYSGYGELDFKYSQPGNSYQAFNKYELEDTSGASFERQSGQELQMYFVNTL